jgi:membrane-associated phospholipid phosphatase
VKLHTVFWFQRQHACKCECMNRFAVTIALFIFGFCASAQNPASDGKPVDPPATAQSDQEKPADPKPATAGVDVQPGQTVIKQKDLWDATGYFHPFVRMPKYILQDQKAIWTSPFHTSKNNLKYWLIFGGATGALIATDKWTVKQLPNSSAQVNVSNWVSRVGSAYTLVPLSAGFYFIGTAAHDDHFRETGLLAFETLIDVNLVAGGLKLVADRARPLQNNGTGRFEDNTAGRWGSGFPSGHAINTWALASVIAHQYSHHKIVPILAYGLASTVIVARVGARQHFPGDVVAGSAMGWFIGDFVYGKRHNRELDHKPTFADKVLDRVQLGGSIQ